MIPSFSFPGKVTRTLTPINDWYGKTFQCSNRTLELTRAPTPVSLAATAAGAGAPACAARPRPCVAPAPRAVACAARPSSCSSRLTVCQRGRTLSHRPRNKISSWESHTKRCMTQNAPPNLKLYGPHIGAHGRQVNLPQSGQNRRQNSAFVSIAKRDFWPQMLRPADVRIAKFALIVVRLSGHVIAIAGSAVESISRRNNRPNLSIFMGACEVSTIPRNALRSNSLSLRRLKLIIRLTFIPKSGPHMPRACVRQSLPAWNNLSPPFSSASRASIKSAITRLTSLTSSAKSLLKSTSVSRRSAKRREAQRFCV